MLSFFECFEIFSIFQERSSHRIIDKIRHG